jgi:hypothetical protein
MITAALDFTGACALVVALAWAVALVIRADSGFAFRRPVAIQPYLPHAPSELLRAHARAANMCDACHGAPWDYRTRNDEYLCSVCARRSWEMPSYHSCSTNGGAAYRARES